jgi:type II secretory pathway component PulF
MPRFRYEARTPDNRQVAEEFDADSAVAAITAIEERGWVVLSMVRMIEEERAEGSGQQAEAQVRTLSHVVEAALPKLTPLVSPLRAYADELPPSQRTELLSVTELLAKANTAAIANDITARPTWWLPLLSAADEPTVTAQLARFADESQANTVSRQRWWWSLSYPLVVLMLSLLVLVLLGRTIVPGFAEIFRDFGLQLPLATQLSLAFSNLCQGWGVFIPPLVMLLAVVIAWWGAQRIERLPLVGPILASMLPQAGMRAGRAQLARYLTQLLDTGLPTKSALATASAATNQTSIRKAGEALAERKVLDAHKQWKPIRAIGPVNYWALTADLPKTTQTRVLAEISNCYGEQTHPAYRQMWFGPLAIVFVGLVVGWVVMSLFLPLVKLVEGLS